MYAVFEDGGKQYKVSEGDALLIERRDLDQGRAKITFDKVLMVGEGQDARIGTPWVKGATVTAKGFSIRTCLLDSIARQAIREWESGGVATETISISWSLISSAGVA